MMSWIDEYLGKPYKLGASGPVYYDCYGLVVDVSLRIYGRNVLEGDGHGSAQERISRELSLDSWRKKGAPEPGDPCILWKGSTPAHIGIWTEFGMLHTTQARGAVLSQPLHLRAERWKWVAYESVDTLSTSR